MSRPAARRGGCRAQCRSRMALKPPRQRCEASLTGANTVAPLGGMGRGRRGGRQRRSRATSPGLSFGEHDVPHRPLLVSSSNPLETSKNLKELPKEIAHPFGETGSLRPSLQSRPATGSAAGRSGGQGWLASWPSRSGAAAALTAASRVARLPPYASISEVIGFGEVN